MARAVPPPVAPARPKLSALDVIAFPLAMAGALFALIASFLPWVSGLGQDTTYWEASKVEDVLLVLFVLAVIALATAVLISPGTRPLRLLALGLIAGLVDFVFTEPLEFISRDLPGFSGKQAGEFVALMAAAMLATALVLQLMNMRSAPAADPPRLPLLFAIGLTLIAIVGLLQPLVELLPISHGFSAWEAYTASDVV